MALPGRLWITVTGAACQARRCCCCCCHLANNNTLSNTKYWMTIDNLVTACTYPNCGELHRYSNSKCKLLALSSYLQPAPLTLSAALNMGFCIKYVFRSGIIGVLVILPDALSGWRARRSQPLEKLMSASRLLSVKGKGRINSWRTTCIYTFNGYNTNGRLHTYMDYIEYFLSRADLVFLFRMDAFHKSKTKDAQNNVIF